ncbi:MAG: cytochrome c-type biogenesis protein CcmH [Acidobacteria bacterium]|nr:cytochrome c-type biogenesis protein CcmH [Acidobacteriota bacterium]MBS1865893.1 cytochrome c-type biogenesis protein CcmH [Acidobacteriota bacterium]
MTRARRILAVAFVLIVAIAPAIVVQVQAEIDHAHELGKQLKCTCGGCEQSAGTCYHVGGQFSGPCGVAKMMIGEIQKHLDEGMTDDKVIAAMIKEYGPGAYMEPPKQGFGLVAWLMPGIYLIAGAGLVLFVISRWRKRGVAAAGKTASAKPVSPELLERARLLAQEATKE